MQAAATRDRLVEVLTPVVDAAGLELEEVELTPAGPRTRLRLVVDADGGVTVDRLAGVTAAV